MLTVGPVESIPHQRHWATEVLNHPYSWREAENSCKLSGGEPANDLMSAPPSVGRVSPER